MSDMEKSLIGAKFPREEADLIRDICQARGEGISSFVRMAIRVQLGRLGYLDRDECKTLGLAEASEREREPVGS
ncbi:MAG: hypothetical protein KAW09_04410 [Thermoplasmata archaeon]|nr:hypothetical protein [Thermoplasmata archaeon]